MPAGGPPVSPEQWAQWMEAPQSGMDIFRAFMANEVTREVMLGGIGNAIAVAIVGMHYMMKRFLAIPRAFVDPIVAASCVFGCGYLAVWGLMELSETVQVAWLALSVYGTFVGAQVVARRKSLPSGSSAA